MPQYKKIPNLPGGAMNYVVRQATDAEKRAKGGMRKVDPSTMDPRLKQFLKKIGAL